jgi:hypothetical protein
VKPNKEANADNAASMRLCPFLFVSVVTKSFDMHHTTLLNTPPQQKHRESDSVAERAKRMWSPPGIEPGTSLLGMTFSTNSTTLQGVVSYQWHLKKH